MKTTAALKTTYHVPKDVIFHFDQEGRLIAFNVFAKTHVEINAGLVSLLHFLQKGHTLQEIQNHIEQTQIKIQAKDLTFFSNALGLLEDPTNLVRNHTDIQNKNWVLDFDPLVKLLTDRFILITDDAEYRNYFKPKENLFDSAHFGNFHQQLGHELRLVQRTDPDLWWTRQKYKDQADTLNNNLYRFIQLHFYENFFKDSLHEKNVLDVGCGTGFYSRFLAKKGAKVLGIDPTEKYLSLAKEATPNNLSVEYTVMDIAGGTPLETLPSEKFDWIIFQDALMFYFVPYGNKKLTTRKKVLSELKRSLNKNGKMLVLEPHGLFWLLPWLGDEDYPFTIMTEYREKQYGVTPSLEMMSEAFAEAGFLIKRIHELPVDPLAKEKDNRAFRFSHQFPQWWAFELIK